MTSTDRTPPGTVRLDDVPGLIAALPYLMGFHPRESLVLVATRGRRLGLTVRVDLPVPVHRRTVADAVVGSLMIDEPEGAAVVVVGAGAGPPHRPLVDRVVGELERRQVDVHTVLWAESTARGARWGCYDPCGCGGELPDPTTTVAVATAVAGGRVALADRRELERLVAPVDGAAIRRRERLLVAAHDCAASAAGTEPDDLDGLLAVVDAALADTVAGRLMLDDDRVVGLTMALVEPLVRDMVMVRCAEPLVSAAPRGGTDPASSSPADGIGSLPAAAEQLWAALAREIPDPEAAEPAALLAVSALLRGDGALANVALDRAEQAWPGHRLAGLLRQVAEAGMRPAAFRACLGPGFGDVEDIGVGPVDGS